MQAGTRGGEKDAKPYNLVIILIRSWAFWGVCVALIYIHIPPLRDCKKSRMYRRFLSKYDVSAL